MFSAQWTAESPEGETLNGSQSAVVGKHFGRGKGGGKGRLSDIVS